MRLLIFYFSTIFLYASFPGQQADTSRLQLDIALTGNIQTGNFERLQFVNQLDISLNSKDEQWNFSGRHLYLFQEVFGNKTQGDHLMRNFLTYRIDKQHRWDVFGAVFLEKYFIKRINLHTQIGMGSRYALVKRSQIYVQLGLMGSYTNKESSSANFTHFENNGEATLSGIFVSPIINTHLILSPKRLIFDLLFWFQQDISESQNWRFNLETALLVPVRKGFSWKVSFNNFYEKINVEGVKANDNFLTYGLTYSFHHERDG